MLPTLLPYSPNAVCRLWPNLGAASFEGCGLCSLCRLCPLKDAVFVAFIGCVSFESPHNEYWDSLGCWQDAGYIYRLHLKEHSKWDSLVTPLWHFRSSNPILEGCSPWIRTRPINAFITLCSGCTVSFTEVSRSITNWALYFCHLVGGGLITGKLPSALELIVIVLCPQVHMEFKEPDQMVHFERRFINLFIFGVAASR